MGNPKISIIWKTSGSKATQKRGEIWDSGVLWVEHTWGTFDLVAFKAIMGVIFFLRFFQKYDFRNAAISTLINPF